ncbi:hypothetical protein [Pelagibacterium lentulum]|uniref:Uncharacterized protein n=1 Tax=Pelagibacterium lentulum TaxID=2029865 RepID=A0A916RH20_9HYPH|nr:hypothetical protein [Pelagibacterium lentulum]GGA57316.1 hypothetical protein GCM10011499_29460 [Pelagibacterium lentulum]
MADSLANGPACSLSGIAQVVLMLGEELLDRFKVGRVIGHEDAFRASRVNCVSHGLSVCSE